MKPVRVLGHDPAPGDPFVADRLAGVLRDLVISLAQSRQRIVSAIGPATIWQGGGTSTVADALEPLLGRLRSVEDALVDFSRSWESWRAGLAERRERVAELTEAVASLAGDAAATARREALLVEARELADVHAGAADELETAAETLVEALAEVAADPSQVVTDLAAALAGLSAGVEQWMAETATQLGSTVVSVEDAAELTASMSVLLGVGGGEVSERALGIAALAPGAHRLASALSSEWADGSADLPTASFESAAASSLADRLGQRAATAVEEEPS